MDDMDVDQVVEVPDTPDRLAHNFKGKSCIRRDSHLSSTSNLFGNADISNDGLIGGLRNKNEQATKRESKRMSIPPRKSSNKSELQGNIRNNSSGAALSSGSVFHLKRIAGDTIYNHGEKTSIQPEYIGKGKAISSFNSQMPAHGGHNTVVDLTEQDDHSKECPKIIIGSSQARQHRKELLDKSSPSLLNEDSANGNKFENPRTSNRTSSQKRLVRNGCISPLNVAKATQSAQKQNHSFPHSHQDGSGTSREPKAEDMDSRRVKGKGLLTHNILSKESDAKMRPLSDRTHAGKVDISIPAKEDAFEQSNRASGWISTRGRTRKLNPPLPDEEHLLFRRAGDPSNANKMPRNEVVRSNNKEGSNARKHPVSSQNVSVASITQTVSQKHQGCQLNECPGPSNTVLKRKKQGSSRSHHGDSSSSVVDDSQLVVLGSPGEPSNIRSVGTQNSHTAHSFNRIINIDEINSETRSNSSYSINSSNNRESDVRARQLEADEVFAMELQEQLYNESNVAADREIDENVALALQQGSLPHAFSSGTHHASHSRSSLVPNLHRQNQSRPSQNASNRRVTQTRNPAPRMARLRGRFPGQSRTISSRQRNAMFPSDMDVDMRMHILEALEAFNDMGVTGNILQAQRDFNENDYEMLLALDENNHQHGGASASQINGLPESTVQMDNLEECSICLETPSIGDTIRHLPCLHKFHKDCIDEWLRRKTSCPVCKSSIT